MIWTNVCSFLCQNAIQNILAKENLTSSQHHQDTKVQNVHLHGSQRYIQRNNRFPWLAAAITLDERLLFLVESFRQKSSWQYFASILTSVLLGCCLYRFDNHLCKVWSANASFWWSKLHCCPPAKLAKVSRQLKNRVPRESNHHCCDPPIPQSHFRITLLSSWCLSSKAKL